MYGVALEGGGARGAYHVGAMKAVYECGFEVGGIVGTSIGAFNSAVIAQGDFDKLYDLWYNGSSSLVIDMNEKELRKVVEKKMDLKSLKYWYGFVTNGISNKGLDTTRLRELYSNYIDEEKLRKSTCDYGLVTVSLTDKKPVYMVKENIAPGRVVDYVLASSNLPVFRQEKLSDGKSYIDGGFYDNCPIKILVDKGYREIIEIRTEAIGRKKNINRDKLEVYTISPSKDLGSILFSDNQNMKTNILMGYYDALRAFKGYLGKAYYIIPINDEEIFNRIVLLTDEAILKVTKGMKQLGDTDKVEPKKLLFERILPYISDKLKYSDTSSYQKLVISVLEEFATDMKIPMYKLYDFDEFFKLVKSKSKNLLKKEEALIIKNVGKILMLRLILELN